MPRNMFYDMNFRGLSVDKLCMHAIYILMVVLIVLD